MDLLCEEVNSLRKNIFISTFSTYTASWSNALIFIFFYFLYFNLALQ